MSNEVKVKAEILDMPLNKSGNSRGIDLIIHSLSTMSDYDYLLSIKPIQIIIDYQWEKIRPNIIYALFIPFLL